jgi:toxin ParE1/3/4
VAKVRLARTVRADIARILAASGTRWGIDGRGRYEGLLSAAIRQVGADPEGRLTKLRTDLPGHLRSFHLRRTRTTAKARVRTPAHILYYRVMHVDLIEVVAVLHDRMDPVRHLAPDDQN